MADRNVGLDELFDVAPAPKEKTAAAPVRPALVAAAA